MLILLLALGCGGDPICESPDCVMAISGVKRWEGAHPYAQLGLSLAVGDKLVAAGAISGVDDVPLGIAYAVALPLPDFRPRGAWTGFPGVFDYFGDDTESVAYLVDTAQRGDRSAPDVALAEFRTVTTGEDIALVGFGEVGSAGVDWLIGLRGCESCEAGGLVHGVDPSLTGHLDKTDARFTLTGGPMFGYDPVAWDADGDGQQDLVVGEWGALRWFLGPIEGDRDAADSDGLISAEGSSNLVAVGDVTGDGAADLAIGEPSYERQGADGRVSLLLGGTPEQGPVVVAVPRYNDRLGFAVAGGDIDGDGQVDLLLTAFPSVLLFFGPVGDGVLDELTADAEMRGEFPGDYFGAALAVADADGDGQSDVVIGAPKWPGSAFQGAVYLVPGADWLR